MSKIDKTLIRENIKCLANKKKIKIGEVEAQAGVSAGYLSRTVGDNSSANSPLLDLIIAFADRFGVTIDSLINVNFSKLTSDEQYLADFFHNLIFKTRDHQINWTAETNDKLTDYEYIEHHPLFYVDDNNFINYHSYFNRFNRNEGNVYYTDLNGTKFYMIKVIENSPIDTQFGYELYFYNPQQKELTPICPVKSDSILYSVADELYMTAQMSGASTHVSENARSIIDNIMKPPLNNYSQQQFINSYPPDHNPNNNVWNYDDNITNWNNNDYEEDISYNDENIPF